MKAALLKRLQRLEEVRGVQCRPPEFQVGYLKELPADYTGERHIVTVGRDADGMYKWEERRGLEPTKAKVILCLPSESSLRPLRSIRRRERSRDRRRYFALTLVTNGLDCWGSCRIGSSWET